MTSTTTERSRWSTYLVLAAVIGFFCLPLFIGLRGWDLRSDEAIYSYSVDRILETGEWLTPQIIPYDDPFLEKPPLKFWLVAGAIRAGLPHDEFGLRFIDAVMGAMAFIYVFWLGCRLSGSLCGFIAVLVLFTIESLLFEHGIRGNHMEAPLLLAYCGGIYHFARWVEDPAGRRRWLHPLAVSLYFTLGFMTKFVAVFFLPLVCVIALAWRRDALARLRSGWRDWVLPAAAAIALIAPWFVYQAVRDGEGLWRVMFGEHVVTRFTGVLDPRHQQPWHHYFSHLWSELADAGSQWISLAGVFMLAAAAWRGRPWLARLLLVWWLVPFVLISAGTSKVFHYAFPFLPPIALGAGLAAAALAAVLHGLIARGARAAGASLRTRLPRLERVPASGTLLRQVLLAGAVFCVGLAIWTLLAGRITWKIGGVQILKNTSTFRPLVIAAILLGAGRHTALLTRGLALAAVAAFLPVAAYDQKLFRARTQDHPLRSVVDCARTITSPPPQTRVYPLYEELVTHSTFYYLRQAGPWTSLDRHPSFEDLRRDLFEPGRQTLVVLFRRDYEAFVQHIMREPGARLRLPAGFEVQDDMLLLTPGPFEACGRAAIAGTDRQLRYVLANGEMPR